MRKRWIQLIAGLAMVVLCISTCTTTTNAALIWEDDFDDGTFAPEWTICDNQTFHDGGYGWNGSTWDASNNYLELTEAPGDWGIISHPSDVAYGTWSFDFKDNESQVGYGRMANILFISNSFYDREDLYANGSSYFIHFDVFTTEEPHNFTLSLVKRFNNERIVIDVEGNVPVAGWHHIVVTRNTTGYFYVYHNDSLIMQGEDTDIDTSEMLWMWNAQWQMVDNFVVYDEVVDHTSTPTTTTPTSTPTTAPPPFPPLVIGLIGGISAGVVILLVIVVLRRK
jgi:hypothetical protein